MLGNVSESYTNKYMIADPYSIMTLLCIKSIIPEEFMLKAKQKVKTTLICTHQKHISSRKSIDDKSWFDLLKQKL